MSRKRFKKVGEVMSITDCRGGIITCLPERFKGTRRHHIRELSESLYAFTFIRQSRAFLYDTALVVYNSANLTYTLVSINTNQTADDVIKELCNG